MMTRFMLLLVVPAIILLGGYLLNDALEKKGSLLSVVALCAYLVVGLALSIFLALISQ